MFVSRNDCTVLTYARVEEIKFKLTKKKKCVLPEKNYITSFVFIFSISFYVVIDRQIIYYIFLYINEHKFL